MKIKYTVAFMFSKDLGAVALVLKAKPDWQKGRYNGIGGKVEPGETFSECNVREFEEETGLKTKPEDWSYFARIESPNVDIGFFTTRTDEVFKTKTPEGSEEQINTHFVSGLVGAIARNPECAVENLGWLICLALDHLQDGRPTFANIHYAQPSADSNSR